MNRTVLSLAIILMFSLGSLAQSGKIPTFRQYSVKAKRMKAKAPILKSHKDARLFRTNLRNAAKKGINFAGHFVLTYWGCGASCGVGAIIDARTGRVFFPKELDGVWANQWPDSYIPFGFRKNSRLLILNGYEPNDYAGDRKTHGLHYYVWTGSNLRQVRFIPKDWRGDGD